MSSQTIRRGPQPDTAPPTTDDELVHIVCSCDEDRALCGADVTEARWDVEGTECVVCADLDSLDCERCGA